MPFDGTIGGLVGKLGEAISAPSGMTRPPTEAALLFASVGQTLIGFEFRVRLRSVAVLSGNPQESFALFVCPRPLCAALEISCGIEIQFGRHKLTYGPAQRPLPVIVR